MSDDLHARIATALRDHDRIMDGGDPARDADDGYECCAEAVMAVVGPEIERVRTHARDYSRGLCRSCGATDPATPFPEHRQRPHRMWCRLYVGPLEHHKSGERPGIYRYMDQCACGRAYHAEDGDCPDGGVDWRGPRPDGDGAA
jgi:hypothetical protein